MEGDSAPHSTLCSFQAYNQFDWCVAPSCDRHYKYNYLCGECVGITRGLRTNCYNNNEGSHLAMNIGVSVKSSQTNQDGLKN